MMKQVDVAIIGTGWCGGIRAEMLAKSALVDRLHLCDIRGSAGEIGLKASAGEDYFGLIYIGGTVPPGEEGDGATVKTLCKQCHTQG